MNTYLAQKFNGKITMKQLFNPKIYLMVMFFCMTLTSNAVTKTNPKTIFGSYTIKVENHTTRNFYVQHRQKRFDNEKYKTYRIAYLAASGNPNHSNFHVHKEAIKYDEKDTSLGNYMWIKDINGNTDVSRPNIVIMLKSKFNVKNYHYNKDITNVSQKEIQDEFEKNYKCFVEQNITNNAIKIYTDVELDSQTEPNGDKRTSVTLTCMLAQEASKEDQIFLNSDIEMRDMIFSPQYMLH